MKRSFYDEYMEWGVERFGMKRGEMYAMVMWCYGLTLGCVIGMIFTI